ncbi:DNA-binding LacI/PurR family transcriptional regulator [Diaminobutyricimonas aerilata]|uniref:DNA-binding LacI/PurR family transcriptional regulator n=1 Tax=Diaminobutyricimonas aerilata TaxID=1162967 RepID=A0A2M9CGN2_9MICO|nr:LacI family DNA-binding transcriptional regulator [Diaminobutyricimonas aerilata]PJJ71047.1 DNA-binding LacI/PurR family transcriptional regulator [Diaminobutyricimonas aerilata]
MTRPASVTLQDVAALAGVSIKTVSNVVREYQHVRPSTRARVQDAIDRLGYVPHSIARRLATGRTGMIAFALPAIEAPYFAELAALVSTEADGFDYRLLIEQTAGSLEDERAVLRGRERGLIDGLIFQPTVLDAAAIEEFRGSTPLVLLGEIAAPPTVDHVMVDNTAAARAATLHLLQSGRTRVAFLGQSAWTEHATTRLRMGGYRSALEEFGAFRDDDLLIPMTRFGAFSAEAAVVDAIEAGVRFDGLVCFDDLSAIGAMKALARTGRIVPDDVGVVGWDDILMAQFTNPGLTTIRPDKAALVRTTFRMLRERMDGASGPGRHELVGFDLVVRGSTAS